MKIKKLLAMLLIAAILGLSAVAEDGIILQAEPDGEAVPAESDALLLEAGDEAPAEAYGLLEEAAGAIDAPLPEEAQANAASAKDFTISGGVLEKYTGAGGAVTVPNTVSAIAADAFWGCSGVTSIVVPNSVTSIGQSAFANCVNLTLVVLSINITSLEDSLFSGDSKLAEVNIPEGVVSIGAYAFNYCTSLPSIDIPGSVGSIGTEAFWGCSSLKSVTIPSGVNVIEEGTFALCSKLKTVKLPKALTSIGRSAFWKCTALKSLSLPTGVTTIDLSAFEECTSLTNVIVPGTVNSLDQTFKGCSSLLTAIVMDGVTEICDSAFGDCPKLKAVAIPKSVTYMGIGIFDNSPKVTVYVESDSYIQQWCQKEGIPWKIGSVPVITAEPTATATPKPTPKPTKAPSKTKTFYLDKVSDATKLNVGDKVQIAVSEGTISSCSSDDKKTAKVTKKGLVTGVAHGKANITVKVKVNKKTEARKLTVSVIDPKMPTKISLDHKKVKLNLKDELTLKATVKPSTASTGLKWSSSDPSVVSVTSKGVIKGKKHGTATITVTAKKDESVFATLPVTVVDPKMPTKIAFVDKTVALQKYNPTTLETTMTPTTAKSDLIWSSSDDLVATVDSKGVIRGHRAGSAKITVTTKKDPNVKASITVKVKGKKPKFRALLIGNINYTQFSKQPSVETDLKGMKSMLKGLGDKYTYTVKKDRTAEQILKDIKTYLGSATEDDVSLFYYSGHGYDMPGRSLGALVGIGDDYGIVTSSDLYRALEKVKGRVIVLIDACHSGALIQKNSSPSSAEARCERFVQDFIDAFEQPSVVANTGEFREPKYVVFVAAAPDESSWPRVVNNAGRFTSTLCKGLGCDIVSPYIVLPDGAMWADKDNNKYVTVSELYSYIKKHINETVIDKTTLQTVGYYADDKNEILFCG